MLVKVFDFLNFLVIDLLNNLFSSSSTSTNAFTFLGSFPPLFLLIFIYSDIFFHIILYFFFHVSTYLWREWVLDLYDFSNRIFWFFNLFIWLFNFIICLSFFVIFLCSALLFLIDSFFSNSRVNYLSYSFFSL